MKQIGQILISIAICLAACIHPDQAMAQDVILNPGYIHGNVTITGENIYKLEMDAEGCSGHSSTETFNSTDTYDLTVHVEGSACDYALNCTAYTSEDTSINLIPLQVTVQDGLTTEANFSLSPGYVTGTVSMTGGTVNYGRVYSQYSLNGKYITGETAFSSDGSFLLPVVPGQGIRLYGYVYDSQGIYYNLEPVDIDVLESQTITSNWTVQAGTATMEGHIGFGSIFDFYSIYVSASGPEASGKTCAVDLTTLNYQLTDLLPGDWSFSNIQFYINGGEDILILPESYYAQTVTLPPGGTVVNSISAIPAFVNGRIWITGSKSIDQVSGGSVAGFGVYGNESQGGRTSDIINSNTGGYDLVLTQGTWEIYRVKLHFSQYDGTVYVNSELTFDDYSKRHSYGGGIELLPMETVDDHNFEIATGSATVNFTVEGEVFSAPPG